MENESESPLNKAIREAHEISDGITALVDKFGLLRVMSTMHYNVQRGLYEAANTAKACKHIQHAINSI